MSCVRDEGLRAVPGEAPAGPDGTGLPGGRGSPGGLGGTSVLEEGVPRSRKMSKTEVHGSGADKCCGYKVTIDHRTLSRCIS